MESEDPTRAKSRALLLERAGLVFLEAPAADAPRLPERYVQGVALELAELGFALSTRLSERLATLPLAELAALQASLQATLAAALGADRKHVPLFRKFPHDVPADTLDLWWRKVLVHFLQEEGQPCLFCGHFGTAHVLRPCRHVVCDHCFDGANYSACPVCERPVDRSSPFFLPTPEERRTAPLEPVRFKRLDLGGSLDAAARDLLLSFCRRPQALSPTDAAALETLLADFRERALAWLPPAIPVKEIAAQALGTLFRVADPNAVLPVARRHLATATDVLRLLAAMSGADPSLARKTVVRRFPREDAGPRRFWGKVAELLGAPAPSWAGGTAFVPLRIHRFPVARLPRPLRRALLSILEGLDADRLVEDMLRHREYWVWVGEFLHPHEFARRFPNVARAFAIVRKKAPDGTPAPPFQGYYGQLEAAVAAGDAAAMTALLASRPGELARRFDHALRVAGDAAGQERLLTAFVAAVPAFSTPVLVTLRSLLPTRTRPAPIRVYWPKGQVAKGVAAPDTRAPLPEPLVAAASRAAEAELLRRFAAHPTVGDAIVDTALAAIVAPFNERTASPAAVALPRGSRIDLPAGQRVRLFLHWCEPETGGETTDLDLSIGFYDAAWQYVGVCSYYQLRLTGRSGAAIAVSAGDLRAAPFPNGATEFVDLDRELAAAEGIRYAVMVANNYDGMPFSLLERAFAGLMLRASGEGPHFDPRTVELKFNLQGENGVFLPMVVDLGGGTLHWLDVYSKGQFEFNNVATSSAAITRICPDLIAYFGSGVRASLYDLALLHAAARAARVHLRRPGAETALFVRRPGEEPQAFLDRLRGGAPDATGAPLPGPGSQPAWAALHRGDLELPAGSTVYALFREGLTGTIAASDLLA